MSRHSEPLQRHFKYEKTSPEKVLQAERNHVVERRTQAVTRELLPESVPVEHDSVSESLTGLALSGGGIRSGALGLGILQGLYRSGLLPFFDYLSTVSGGGYAGAYLTSAGSGGRSQSEEAADRATDDHREIPYGRLKAFHDGEGMSERMQRFIFGGHYLLRTRRFFNRHLMGLCCIWFLVITGLSTLATLAAMLFRQLDQPLAIHFLSGLGLRTDISRGFFPVTCLIILWFVCWCISFFRAAGNLSRAQGRFAAKLIPTAVVVFGICLASLLGNGELNLDWISSDKEFNVARWFASADSFLHVAIYGLIGVGLLPYLKPAALIRSGANPQSTTERVVFAVASRVMLYGLPFLLVSWFARENISGWTEHRFVPHVIREFGLRQPSSNSSETIQQPAGDEAAATSPSLEQTSREQWNDFVILTKNEVADWSDWQPTCPPLWARLRDQAGKESAARKASLNGSTSVEVTVELSDSVGTDDALSVTEINPDDASDEVPGTSITTLNDPGQGFSNAPRAGSKRKLADFLWGRLNRRLSETAEDMPIPELKTALLSSAGPDASKNLWEQEPCPVDRILTYIHEESLELQALYSRTGQNTEDYAPGGPDLAFYRLLSLASLFPDSLQGDADRNYFGRIVRLRQNLGVAKGWLAEHLSRILETTNLGLDCDWSELDQLKNVSDLRRLTSSEQSRLEALLPLVNQAALLSDRHRKSTPGVDSDGRPVLVELPKSAAERRDLARLNRSILNAAFPGVLRDPSTVFAVNVLAFDQATRWTTFKWCLGLFVFASLMINVNATTLHGFYARELANNWIQSDEDSDMPLKDADATPQGLPYHLLSGSVHWMGTRRKAAGEVLRDHFLLSPLYCGCEKTGFVETRQYKDHEIGLGDAIAISGAAVSPIQQVNPLLQSLLWLANLRLGQWLPNPNHGTFLPTKSRKLIARIPVTPWRLMMRIFQVAERRPFLFVTDGGHHENLGIGPLLKRRCRFILAIDAGQDAEYAFSDLSRLMRWARVKHNVKLQPVDSLIDTDTDDPLNAARDSDDPDDNINVMESLRSAIDAWNDLAPDNGQRLSSRRLSSRHFVVLRIHYPDVDGPSWLIYAKTSLTGDEPAELIRYAESDKEFPHNPTSNQFYSPDMFEAYRQLGEHMIESMTGQLPSIIASKIGEHRGRPESPYLSALLNQINTARQALPLNLSAAPPTPEADDLIRQLAKGRTGAVSSLDEADAQDIQGRLARRLSVHPLFVAGLLKAALCSGARLKPRLMSFLFPELGPEASPARQIFSQRRLPGRAKAMLECASKPITLKPDETMTESLLQLAESLAVIPADASEFQKAQQNAEYDSVYRLLTKVRGNIRDGSRRDRVDQLAPRTRRQGASTKKKSTARRKPPQA